MIGISTTDFEGDGEWSGVIPLTIIPLHAMVLPDGKVLGFGSTELGMQGGQFVYSLYDPETGVERVLPNTTGTNIFCSYMSLDPQTGNVIIMGGDGAGNGGAVISGIDEVIVFDYETQTVRPSEFGEMAHARWYPTSVNLPNGEILVIGGRDENYVGSSIPEVYNPATGFRELPGAEMPDIAPSSPADRLDGTWWYPHMWVNSRSEVIVVEAYGDDIYRLDPTGLGAVEKIGQTPFSAYKLNSSIMYDVDQVAILGDDGGIWVADISEPVPQFTRAASIEGARTNAGLIVLPDGRVAITGGANGGYQGNDINLAVYNVTVWDPDTNSVTQHAEQALARLYHSSHLLLPDGTLWSAGGGAPGPLTNTNAEIYAPTYLYGPDGTLAARPEIAAAPANISAGDSFRITVADSSEITMVTAIKSGGMTHGRNSDGRFLDLDYTVIDGTTIEVSTPGETVMIGGLWMLHVVDAAGVPSAASLMGVDMAPLVATPPLEQTDLQYFNIDDDEINGPFEATVEARFDDIGGGNWQRVFDFGNGEFADNIWLGQVANSADMRFEVLIGGTGYPITAPGAIVEGEIAEWTMSVDGTGLMRLFKNGELLVEGRGAVPRDVERTLRFVGDSNWVGDSRLQGLVRNLEIVNAGDVPEEGGQNPVPTGLVFEALATARFDDLGGGVWQRVFDYGNGPDADNIWLGQVAGSADMRFEVLAGAEKYAVTAPGALVEGEVADWRATVDDTGVMRLYKNGALLAEAQGLVPPDVDRNIALVGESNYAADTPLIGAVLDISVSEDGPLAPPEVVVFEALATARFDDLGGGAWQRVFDYGNGPDADNIWLGQVAGSTDMRFEVLDGAEKYAVTAPGVLVEGEVADWRATVSDLGIMRLYKNGALVAEGAGIVPPDVTRENLLVGASNYAADTPLIGEVLDLQVDGEAPPGADPGVAFEALSTVRFDDLQGGDWQRVFDYGNGPDADNIWLGQVAGSADMRFEVLDGAEKFAITAAGALVEGEIATWTATIADDGIMQLYKDGALLAEGPGVVPPDVVRASALVGQSNYAADTPLIGKVFDLALNESGPLDPQEADAPLLNGDAFEFGQNLYVAGTPGLTWQQAQAEAEAMGGTLVEIDSEEENTFVFETFGAEGPIWLGLTDAETEGVFAGASGAEASYTNWLPGQPDNSGGGQDYAAIVSSDGQWDDAGNAGGWVYDAGWFAATNQTVVEFS